MAATTISDKSVEVTQAEARETSYNPLQPNEHYGRVRASSFNWTTTAAHAAGYSVALVTMPKGARVLESHLDFQDMGTDVDVSLGIAATDGTGEIDDSATSDSTTFFKAATDVGAAAGTLKFASTAATNLGYETQKEVYVTLSFVNGGGGYAVTTGQDFRGYVLYVVD